MTITIRLKTGNAAFEDDRASELALICQQATSVVTGCAWAKNHPIKDSNGNTVGTLTISGK